MAQSIYFDESGYTGTALLDPAQPLFVVASSLVADDKADAVLRESFPTFQGQEFKFGALWRRNRTRRQMLEFSARLGELRDRLYFWTINKRFCVLTKLMDFIVEPVLYGRGLDFYKDGWGAKYANLVHWGLLSHGPELYEATLQPYYEFSRDPTIDRLRLLHWRYSMMATSGPEELRPFFDLAAEGARTFCQHSDLATFDDSNEVQLSSVLVSVGYWRGKLDGELDIYHDASNNFFGQAETWAAVTSNKVPPQLHPQGRGPPMQFPLNVRATTAVDSATSPAIQLCDVFAGLGGKLFKPTDDPEAGELHAAIMDGGFGQLIGNGINPDFDTPDGPPPERSGPDAVDKLAAIFELGLDANQGGGRLS